MGINIFNNLNRRFGKNTEFTSGPESGVAKLSQVIDSIICLPPVGLIDNSQISRSNRLNPSVFYEGQNPELRKQLLLHKLETALMAAKAELKSELSSLEETESNLAEIEQILPNLMETCLGDPVEEAYCESLKRSLIIHADNRDKHNVEIRFNTDLINDLEEQIIKLKSEE